MNRLFKRFVTNWKAKDSPILQTFLKMVISPTLWKIRFIWDGMVG